MLSVRDLTVSLGPELAPVDIVAGVSFDLARGEILGHTVVGGCLVRLLRHVGPTSDKPDYVNQGGDCAVLGTDPGIP